VMWALSHSWIKKALSGLTGNAFSGV